MRITAALAAFLLLSQPSVAGETKTTDTPVVSMSMDKISDDLAAHDNFVVLSTLIVMITAAVLSN